MPTDASKTPYCFCVVGWHFLEDFYQKIYQLDAQKYIICHRDEAFVRQQAIFRRIAQDLIYCPNIGLDWGAYYQFNSLGLHRPYEFVIYLHDDLLIKDTGFAAELQRRFRETDLMVIGNGRNGKDTEFRFGKYKRHMFHQDEDDFLVRSVRGSFLAVRSAVFDVIENYPVYWRAKKMKHGNISLRNFAYLVSKHFGRQRIGYLEPESWLETQYLVELQRGEEEATLANVAAALEGGQLTQK